MRLKQFIKENRCPDCKEGEYPVRHFKRKKVRDLNPKTNRMKNFKRQTWFKTNIPPEERTVKNIPRYNKGEGDLKCSYNEWLGLKGNGSDGTKGYDGKYYGWSHRAIWGFGVGDIIKPDTIGNKYQYSEENQRKYMEIMEKEGIDAADKFHKSIIFEPYTIETEDDARNHVIRFTKGVR